SARRSPWVPGMAGPGPGNGGGSALDGGPSHANHGNDPESSRMRRTAMARISNHPAVHDATTDKVRAAIEHRATWMALTFLELEARGLDAEGITRAAIRKCGRFHGQAIRAEGAGSGAMARFSELFFDQEGKKNFEREVVSLDSDGVAAEFRY